jgi:hypothetical protein
VNTLGQIVDAIMNLNLEEQNLLMQMLESRQRILSDLQRHPVLSVTPSTEIFEDGRLTAGAVQGIMDELNATLDNPNHL